MVGGSAKVNGGPVNALRFSARFTALLSILTSVAAITGFAGIRGPGKYAGTVIFDRWGGCHLYSGVYLMEISEKVKESLRPYDGRAVLIDAQEVFQPMNPGDGLITRFQVLGPAEEPAAPSNRAIMIDGLTLRVIPSFGGDGSGEFIIELRNSGSGRRSIDTNALAPTVLSKKQGGEFFAPSDGPSYAAITRSDIAFLHDHAAGGMSTLNGKERRAKLLLLPGFALPRTFDLNAGEVVEVPIQFDLSPGEYEFIAGYGGGVHEVRGLASNMVGFDVDEGGSARLTMDALALNQVRPVRLRGDICGYVYQEDGIPAVGASVTLWPWLFETKEPRSMITAATDSSGAFRIKSILAGRYRLSAVHRESGGVSIGALGGFRLANGETFSVPDQVAACSAVITLHRQRVYTIRGRTSPAESSRPQRRTVRLILIEGDAFPFESVVEVHPDGQYEFTNVPAGRYQFYGGATGAGFLVNHDIDDLDIAIIWPSKAKEN
jgi:hypothetical protein